MLRLTESDYDAAILHPSMRAIFGHSDLYNLGFWGASPADLPSACRSLVLEHIARDRSVAAPRCVMDVGCGLGAGSAIIARHHPGAEVIGVNYSQAQVDHARAHHAAPNLRFERRDACDLGGADGSVDVIHAVEAAVHFRPRGGFFAEAARLLRPGGRLVLSDVLSSRATSVMPPENVTGGIDDYLAVARASGLEPVTCEDVTDQTLVPFAAHMRAQRHAPVARYMTEIVESYVLAVFEPRAASR